MGSPRPDRGERSRGTLLGSSGGRRLLFAGLYFSEGAPIGFVWWALPVWLRTAGVAPGDIARLVAWVAWPWALKFLWAPAVDALRTPGFGLRGWILSAQLAMAVTLLPLLLFEPTRHPDLLLAALVIHAFAASTQDVAIDSLAIATVPARERGSVNGWMQVGMLGARALFGGGAILLATRVGNHAVVLLLGAAIGAPALLLAFGGRTATNVAQGARPGVVGSRFLDMLKRRQTWVGFAFASLAGSGFESTAALAGPFLIDRGAGEETVGFFFLVPTVACMALGALVGGFGADRLGRRLATGLFEAVAALVVLGLGAAAILMPGTGEVPFFLVLLAVLYFAMGLATAAVYALFMDLTDPLLAATQFAAFMGGINLCYVLSTRALGELIDRFGYGPGFCCMAGVSLAALPILRWMEPEGRGTTGTSV